MQEGGKKELLNHFKHEHIKIPIKMETGEHAAKRIKQNLFHTLN